MGALDEINNIDPAKPKAASGEIKWYYYKEGRDGKRTVSPIYTGFTRLLESLGFARVDSGSDSRLVRIENGSIITPVSKTQIQDAIFEFASLNIEDERECGEVLEMLFARIDGLFNPDRLNRVGMYSQSERREIQKDERFTKYMYFQNGFVVISEKGIEFKDYEELGGYIWADAIMQRKWIPGTKWNNRPEFAPFTQFMRNICGKESRLNDLMVWIGYYLHGGYYGKRQALILTDSTISADSEANGRSGKSLLAEAIGKAMSSDSEKEGLFLNIGGKDFDPTYKHKFQQADERTLLIVINDLKHNFNLQAMFNDVTEGIIAQPKGTKPIRTVAKLLLTANRTVKNEGDSSRDRFIEFELTSHYNSNHDPKKEFGHWFFLDWTPGQWSAFDHFMAECCRRWLHAGLLPRPEQINLSERMLREHTAKDFVDWIEHKFRNKEFGFAQHFDREKDKDFYINQKEAKADFISVNEDYSKLTHTKFYQWVKRYTELKPGFVAFDEKRDRFRNNKDYYICFRDRLPESTT